MKFTFMLKQYFFNAFRELFVHHHGSLEFRAKVCALVISANEDPKYDNYNVVKNLGMQIYKDDDDRANQFMLTTKELVEKVREDNGLNIDTLVLNIQKELKVVPRYAKKIDTESLKPLLKLTQDRDTLSYQENILEFLDKLKEETLYRNKYQIEKDEKELK